MRPKLTASSSAASTVLSMIPYKRLQAISEKGEESSSSQPFITYEDGSVEPQAKRPRSDSRGQFVSFGNESTAAANLGSALEYQRLLKSGTNENLITIPLRMDSGAAVVGGGRLVVNPSPPVNRDSFSTGVAQDDPLLSSAHFRTMNEKIAESVSPVNYVVNSISPAVSGQPETPTGPGTCLF